VSHFKPNYFQRRSKPQGPKCNERIRAIDVQVIGSDGNNLGTLPLNKAIEVAKGEGLDLIEISPNANPPVCKIMDMGKYKYDLQKKTNIAKKKQKVVALKEIKMRPGTDKVKFTVKFKGREMQHINLGRDLMNRIIEDTKDIGKIETHPKFEGRQMIMIIQPI
jgi:translation initiation factor IF-3